MSPHANDESTPPAVVAEGGDDEAAFRPERRLIVVGGMLILAYIGGLIGLALLPILASEQPLLLLFLHPVSGTLFLIAPKFDPVLFVTLATARRLGPHILFYLLGSWYGERAIRWTARRGGEAGWMVATVERLFARLGWAIVLFFPGPLPSVLAGTTKMRPLLFLALDLIGTIASIAIVRAAASAASGPLATALRFIDQNSRWLTVITIIATVAWLSLRGMRQGAREGQGDGA